MTHALHRFLTAEDLDSLLEARLALGVLGPQDEQEVLAMLQRGWPMQGMANLLLHPGVLPRHVRADTVLGALTRAPGTYFQLAAAVGSGVLAADALPDAVRRRFARALLRLVLRGSEVVAQRASVSLHAFARPHDAPLIAAAALHADAVVRGNARAWLFRHCDGYGRLADRLVGLAWPLRARDELRAAFRAFESATPVERLLLLCPRLARIPALREWPCNAGHAP
jgi:hypothetical protein